MTKEIEEALKIPNSVMGTHTYAELWSALRTLAAAYRAITDKLPKTADGVVVIVGDWLYHPDWDCPTYIEVVRCYDESIAMRYKAENGTDSPDDAEYFAEAWYYEEDTGYKEYFIRTVQECYSTREAALAAKGDANDK